MATRSFPPKDAILLARSEACERQAYRYGENAYGFQFHPEADHQLVHEWLAVEGVEDEIAEARTKHGPHTVQDVETQKNHALKGERASLKVTAAIASMFRQRPAEKIQRSLFDQITAAATHRKPVAIEFEGSDRNPAQIRGTIATLLTIPAGDYVILKDEAGFLWPIRVSDIRALRYANV